MQSDILNTLKINAASDRLLTIQEVCDLLQVSTSTLFRMRRAGNGPAWVRVRGAMRYRHSAVLAYLAQAEITASEF